MLRLLFLVFFTADCLFAQSAPAPSSTSPQTPAPAPPAGYAPAPSTPAPTPPQTQHSIDAQNKIAINSDLVVLPVTVKNQKGDLVPDLRESEFRIFDNDVEQSIDVFTEEAFPLSLVVLIDDDLKSKDAAQMAPTLRAITGGISANDEVIVCRFDLDFHPGDEFTSDLDKIWADLVRIQERNERGKKSTQQAAVSPAADRPLGVGEAPIRVPIKNGARPTKALDDAIHSAADLLHDRGLARRKMILIVSDGVNGPEFNRFTYQDSLQALLHDNISVYSLAVGNTLNKGKFQRLTSYSIDSGGDIYYASNSARIESLYSQITEEARHEYTLAYVPRAIHSIDPYHRVEVRVSRPAVTVKTRPGYYVAPSGHPSQGTSAPSR
jgi:Ca-activated chloride channel family protein